MLENFDVLNTIQHNRILLDSMCGETDDIKHKCLS